MRGKGFPPFTAEKTRKSHCPLFLWNNLLFFLWRKYCIILYLLSLVKTQVYFHVLLCHNSALVCCTFWLLGLKHGWQMESPKTPRTFTCLWNWYSTLRVTLRQGEQHSTRGLQQQGPGTLLPAPPGEPLTQRIYCPDHRCTAALCRRWPVRVLQFIGPARPGDLGSRKGLGWPFITSSSVRATWPSGNSCTDPCAWLWQYSFLCSPHLKTVCFTGPLLLSGLTAQWPAPGSREHSSACILFLVPDSVRRMSDR